MKLRHERAGAALAALLASSGSFAVFAVPAAAQNTDKPTAGAAGETIEALRRARDALLEAEDFDAALAPAEHLVERLRAARDPAHAAELGRLARIQTELGDTDAAELNYLDAIDLISETEGAFSVSLIEPYQGLGRSYLKGRRFVEAIAALQHAQHISQRNFGLYNLAQAELIDDLTTAHLGLGDTMAAERLQVDRLETAIRRFGRDDPQVIPFRYRLAGYYEQSRLLGAARRQYEAVLAALEAQPEAQEAAQLAPLRKLLGIELLLGDRDEARARLLAILSRHPQVEAAERARTLAALGDAEIARENVSAASNYYREAHALLGEAPEERERLFGQPVMLDFIAPLTDVDRMRRSAPYAWGTIVIQLDVSADGRASNVATVTADPPGLIEAAYHRRVLETHFRPRLAGGLPTAASGMRFTHYFRYYVEEQDSVP